MAVSRSRRVQIVALLCCALAPSVLVAAGTESAADLEKMHPRANAASLSVPTYSVQVGLDNEIFPAFANFASLQKPQERTWGTVIIKIENPSDVPMHNRGGGLLRRARAHSESTRHGESPGRDHRQFANGSGSRFNRRLLNFAPPQMEKSLHRFARPGHENWILGGVIP